MVDPSSEMFSENIWENKNYNALISGIHYIIYWCHETVHLYYLYHLLGSNDRKE